MTAPVVSLNTASEPPLEAVPWQDAGPCQRSGPNGTVPVTAVPSVRGAAAAQAAVRAPGSVLHVMLLSQTLAGWTPPSMVEAAHWFSERRGSQPVVATSGKAMNGTVSS